jgi:gamma-tubulin complex component 2
MSPRADIRHADRSMKHFFFLDQSEFLNQFFDNAHLELRKPSSASSMTKIQSLLYMAVSNPASASSLDPHKEQLRVVMASTPLYDWLLKVVSKKAGEGLLAAMKASSEIKAEETKKKERDITSQSRLTLFKRVTRTHAVSGPSRSHRSIGIRF